MYPYLRWSPLPLWLFVQMHVTIGTPVALDTPTSSALYAHSPVDSTPIYETSSHDRQSSHATFTFSIPSGRTTDLPASANSKPHINSASIDIIKHHEATTQSGVGADNAKRATMTAADTKLSVLVVGVVAIALLCHYWDLL
ncbi:hypothetical protein C8Q74DRAFT_313431 [Fomes fomentarius]|nr:hypothetical protein C8Q74DRAFT_313431 [Fomes fomentarius]